MRSIPSTCLLSFYLQVAFAEVGQTERPKRYLLYDTNPGEGFNLRRDVYIRIANLVKDLRKDGQYDWTLVLPPWGRIGYHWQERDMEQSRKRLKTCNFETKITRLFFENPSLV